MKSRITLFLTAFCAGALAHAQPAVEFSPTNNDSSSPFTQEYQITINSSVALKSYDVTAIEAEYCDELAFYLPPKNISGNSVTEKISFNYSTESYLNGSPLCALVTDINDVQTYHSSSQIINFEKPRLSLEETTSINAQGIEINSDNTREEVDFYYTGEAKGTNLTFTLSGQANPNTEIKITDIKNNVLFHSRSNNSGEWRFDNVALAIKNNSAGRIFETLYVKSFVDENSSRSLRRLIIRFEGEELKVDVRKSPNDELNSNIYDSGLAVWHLVPSLNVTDSKMLLLDNAEQCNTNYNADVNSINVPASGKYDFLKDSTSYNKFACLAISAQDGVHFVTPIGLINREPFASFSVIDDVSAEPVIYDTFSYSAHNAASIDLKYISALHNQSKAEALKSCKANNKGVSPLPTNDTLVLSDKTLNAHYLCLAAKNRNGELSYWVSDSPLNIEGGIVREHNRQERLPASELPTSLPIPESMQGTPWFSGGCSGVLMSPRLVFTAAHCLAFKFHPENGIWAHAGEEVYSYLLKKDRQAQTTYRKERRDLGKYFQANRYELGLTVEWYREQIAAISSVNYYTPSTYSVYLSPYFGRGNFAPDALSDLALAKFDIPYQYSLEDVEFAAPLVYSHPVDLNLTRGEYSGHGDITTHWRGGIIHSNVSPGTNIPGYTLIETQNGESGSALWAYDEDFDSYGVIGSVKGGGVWSSLWNHGDTFRKAMADDRAQALALEKANYQGQPYSYKDAKRAIVRADVTTLKSIINSSFDINVNGNNQDDAWLLARAIELAAKSEKKLNKKETPKRRQEYKNRIAIITALMQGGANPSLTIQNPTRGMIIASQDTVLHYAVRINNVDIFKAIWLNTTNYAYESTSRMITNANGETPLYLAAVNATDMVIVKMLFTDASSDLLTATSQQPAVLDYILSKSELNQHDVAKLDWIGKSYSYIPNSLSGPVDLANSPWKDLVCYQVDYQGNSYSFTELALQREQELTPNAVAAIARLGNLSGVNANNLCSLQ